MRLTYFGGPAWQAGALPVHGTGQEALLFRLALDAGTAVSYRALAEDVWPHDLPDDPRAALQSLVSRMRRALGADMIDAVSGGYRLNLDRGEIDLTSFQDLVARARETASPDTARAALALWTGEPWMPDGFDWVSRDLWEDRAHAERLVAAATPTADPTVASALPTPSVSIPAALTALVGRAEELASVTAQLDAHRLVTLIGPGGAGKTTLALETARRADHVVFVELAPAAPGEVWAAVAGAAGRSIRFGEAGTVPTDTDRDRVLAAFAGRNVLLVLDNCEHVSADAAAIALELLYALPSARVLATSREPLGVPGEAFVNLGPLPAADAEELFAQRVRAARGAAPTPAEAQLVTRITRRLDGLPLALELAAAKARTLTLAEIDDGLDDRFALLATGPRVADPRHQTLRALIDWSWETLSDTERMALLAASVFADGIGTADAGAVAEEFATDAGAFDLLVDRSLIRRLDGRFRMLETVREYGLDRLRSLGGEREARIQAARVLTRLATAHDAQLRGPAVRTALAWFDANDESLMAAGRLTQDDAALHPLGLELLRGCLWAWAMRERFDDLQSGIMTLADDDAALDSEPAVVVNALGLMMPAFALAASGGTPPADLVTHFEVRAAEIAEAARHYPSELSLAIAPIITSAAHALATSDPRSVRSWGFEVPVVTDSATPAWTRALLSVLRAAFAQNGGDVETLGIESERALAMFRDVDDVWGIALASQMRSEWLMLQGRLQEALEISDLSTEGLIGLTSVWDVIQQRSLAIGILARLGRLDEAYDRLDDVRVTAGADGSDRALFLYHFTAASVEIAAGNGEAALDHLDATPISPELRGPEEQLSAWAAAKRAHALLLVGRADDARACLRDAIPAVLRTGDQPIIAEVILAAATVFAESGDTTTARRAFAASVRLRGRADETDPAYLRLREVLGEPDAAEGDDDPEIFAALLA